MAWLPYYEWVEKKEREGTWIPNSEWKKRQNPTGRYAYGQVNPQFQRQEVENSIPLTMRNDGTNGNLTCFTIENISGNVYLGSNVGEKILTAIQAATKSIKIISPYVSESMVDKLVNKALTGVNISISMEQPNFHTNGLKLLKKIVFQETHLDNEIQKLKLQKKKRLQTAINLCAALEVFLVSGFLSIPINTLKFYIVTSAAVLFALFIFGLTKSLKRVNKMKVINFSYMSPFKVLKVLKPLSDKSLVHAKIYIVDDAKVFISSANFTNNGLLHNIESLLEVNSSQSIQQVVDYVEHLMNAAVPPSFSIEELGKILYKEQ